jgi:hypothetical protein
MMTNWYWCKRTYGGFSKSVRDNDINITGVSSTEPLLSSKPGTLDASHIYYYATKVQRAAFENGSLIQEFQDYSTNFPRDDFRTRFGNLDTKWQQRFLGSCNTRLGTTEVTGCVSVEF